MFPSLKFGLPFQVSESSNTYKLSSATMYTITLPDNKCMIMNITTEMQKNGQFKFHKYIRFQVHCVHAIKQNI